MKTQADRNRNNPFSAARATCGGSMFEAGSAGTVTGFSRKWLRLAVILVLVLVTWNWWQLTVAQPLAPPDFYRYHADAERMWQGDWKGQHLPPLYPLLSGLFGRILTLVTPRQSAFILSGKILSLLAVLGAFMLFFNLVRRGATKEIALAAATLLALSPVIMKFAAMPLTDLPFLALIMAAITAMFADRRRLAVGLTLAATGVRFEGLLLLALVALLTIPLRRGRWLISIPLLAVSGAILLYLAAQYSPRLINYLEQIFRSDTPNFWSQPLLLLRIFSGNLLFFLPPHWPAPVGMAAATVLTALIAAGAVRAWKLNRQAALAMFLFIAGIIVVKGYILFEGDWRLHTRRLLPALILCAALAVMGLGRVLSSLQQFPRFLQILRVALPLIPAPALISQQQNWPWWIALFLLPVAWFCMKRPGAKDPAGLAATLILAVVFAATGGIGFRQANQLVEAMPNQAAVAVAGWFNTRKPVERERILLLVNPDMVRYYLNKPAAWVEWKPRHWKGKVPLKRYWSDFKGKLRAQKIDKIVLDGYMPATPSRDIISMKALIWRHWRDRELFSSADFITARGRLQALVLTPNLSEEKRRPTP